MKADSAAEYKAMIETLHSNIGTIVEQWAAAASRATFMRGSEFEVPQPERVDRLRVFLDALLRRIENPADKEALETLKSAIRSEQARSLSPSALIRKQSLLRDIMFNVLLKEIPHISRPSAKLSVDAIVDKSIEGIVVMLEEYAELQSILSKWLLASASDPAAVEQSFSRFCRSAMDYFDVEFVTLFRHDPDMKELIVQASSAKSLALSRDSRMQLKSFPLAIEAIDGVKTTLLNEEGSKAPKKKKLLGQIVFSHCVLVPLVRDSTVIGLLMFGDNTRPTTFTPDEVSIAEELARQVVRVIENADSFRKLNLRSRAQKALIETAALLQQEIESEEIYRVVATRLAELVPCQEFAFYVYDWERRVGNPVFAAGPYASETMADRDFPSDVGIAGYVAQTRKAEIVMNSEMDPRGVLIPGTPKTPTRMLAVPVVGQREVIGVIELLRYPPETFNQEDLEIATLFANHASVALENAKLLREVIRVRDQIELSMDLLTHDIANYTTPINAYFSSLKQRKDLDPDVYAAVDKTARQVESIMRLVEMVRTMAKLREAGPKTFKVMNLRKAIDESVNEVRAHAESKAIEFEMFFPGEDMLVPADDMLKEIFTNLFYSAAMSDRNDKTKLTVTAETKKDRKSEFWWVKVAQPSKAIPDHLKGEVLKLTKTSKSELTGGFGIGLAAARGIVNRYAGNMWVSDIVPGDYSKGCMFNILLPKIR